MKRSLFWTLAFILVLVIVLALLVWFLLLPESAGERGEAPAGSAEAATLVAASGPAPDVRAAAGTAVSTATESLREAVDRLAAAVEPAVIECRRDFHRHPELGNRETRTAGVIAERLRALGLEVRTGIAHTGVVGVLRGGLPGPVVALRADMDALPVTEELDLPFKSVERTAYGGREVGVMHACGHDAHMAMALGAAEVLSRLRAELPGTVVFLFQPAEEGAPEGETGGAELMVAEGALDDPRVDAVFALHVFPFDSGGIIVRPGPIMAASDTLTIRVRGRQTHGALPWDGVDPIVTASQIVLGLQTIVSRQADLTAAPAVITVGSFQGGNRSNIIPDEVTMAGTIRTFDPRERTLIHERVRRTVDGIASAAGASAEVEISGGNPVVMNDPALTMRMIPSLARVAAGPFDPNTPMQTVSEDFAVYLQKVPGFMFFLGIAPRGGGPAAPEPNHSPRFFVDESALVTGVRALASLAVDYLAGGRIPQ